MQISELNPLPVHLINQAFPLNKLENQVIRPEPQAYDVCRQLGDCIMNFADRMEAKGLEFEADMEDKAYVLADESMVEIIWNNLLSNAVKFTEPGGKITLTQTTEDGSVKICIADTGCGMDGQTMCRVFDKFYQGDTQESMEDVDKSIGKIDAFGTGMREARQKIANTFRTFADKLEKEYGEKKFSKTELIKKPFQVKRKLLSGILNCADAAIAKIEKLAA